MRRASIDSVWYLQLLEDYDLIAALVSGGMGLKEISEKWEEDGIKYFQMQEFISHNKLKPGSVPGMEVIKLEDVKDKNALLDGTSYCVHRRNCEPYILQPLRKYELMMEDKK